MRGSRKSLAALAAMWFIVSPLLVFAAEVGDGKVPADGKVPGGQPAYGWDGTASRAAGVDANRAMSMKNTYPAGLQTTSATLYGSTLASATEVLSSPFTNAGFYSSRVFNIISTGYTTGGAGLNGGVIYRPLFSQDCVTYAPFVSFKGQSDSTGTVGRPDTLQWRTFVNYASPGVKVSFVNPITGQEIKCACVKIGMYNRGSASVTATITVEGTPEAN